MAITPAALSHQHSFLNQILHGDCIEVLSQMHAETVDLILTDPPYLVGFRDRTGRTLRNDTRDGLWLRPAMEEAYRVLKNHHVMLCFYGWPRAEKFIDAWRHAGFYPIGHMVFPKRYTSKKGFLRGQHEQAYLLAKGNPPRPHQLLSDVQSLLYTGNNLHPTQKAVTSLVPLVRAFTRPGEVVLDAFAGSGSTCAAALLTGRKYIGIELDNEYHANASARMQRIHERIAIKRRSSESRTGMNQVVAA